MTSTSSAPDGYNPEHYLGIVHLAAFQGARRVTRDKVHGYAGVAIGGEPTADQMQESLGYVDEVAFSMLEPLLVCRHLRTGAPLLICGEDDPLHGIVVYTAASDVDVMDANTLRAGSSDWAIGEKTATGIRAVATGDY